MNASVAGLNANANKLATISDNIANSGTYGYKRAVTEFHAMVVGSGKGKYTAGGVATSSGRDVATQGGLTTTSSSTDLAVRGGGMLPVTSLTSARAGGELPMQLTTTGSFALNAEGYLTTGGGNVLMGWPADANGNITAAARNSTAGLEPIRVNTNALTGNPTTRMSLVVNLPATQTVAGAAGDEYDMVLEYFDNLGMSRDVTALFKPVVPATGTSNTWELELYDSAQGNALIGSYQLTFGDSRTAGGSLLSVTALTGGAYDPATGMVTVNVAGGPMEIRLGALGMGGGMTQLSDRFAPVDISKNGDATGTLLSLDIDANGSVRAVYDTGATRLIYQVPLVGVPNPDGLAAMDNQTWAITRDSGSFYLWDAGTGPVGDLMSFALEESTTDLAAELTSLITTQRAYSSNAKVIQTVDEMLQETTNIKR